MKWYFTIHQTSRLIRVEIRPSEGEEGGYISARKYRVQHKVQPADVGRNLVIPNDMSRDEAQQLIEWLQLATLLASQLDHYITTPADFEKRFEARQYNPEVWGSCYVYPVKEEPFYQQKPVEEWREGRREE